MSNLNKCQCQICNKSFISLNSHMSRMHKVEYEQIKEQRKADDISLTEILLMDDKEEKQKNDLYMINNQIVI